MCMYILYLYMCFLFKVTEEGVYLEVSLTKKMEVDNVVDTGCRN